MKDKSPGPRLLGRKPKRSIPRYMTLSEFESTICRVNEYAQQKYYNSVEWQVTIKIDNNDGFGVQKKKFQIIRKTGGPAHR